MSPNFQEATEIAQRETHHPPGAPHAGPTFSAMTAFYELLERIAPLTMAAPLNDLAGLPRNTLGKHWRWMQGKPDGRPCPPKHFPAVVRALVSVYGAVRVGGLVVASMEDVEKITIL